MFLGYIHSFRAIAIIFVVATHVLNYLDWQDTSAIVHNLLLSLMQNGTVMFVFIAGFLFQYTSSRFLYPKYLLTKLKNVIAPYAIIATADLTYHFCRNNGIFAADYPYRLANPVLNIARAYLTGAEITAPMWFVPMIALFYLMAPLLLAIDRRPRAYAIVPTFAILALLIHRPMQLTSILHAAVYFLPAYLAGMWFSHYRELVIVFLRKARWILICFGVALILIEMVIYKHGGAIMSRAPFSTEDGIVDIDFLLKLLISFVLVELLQKYNNHLRGKLDLIAGASFGIFFLHEYAIFLVLMICRNFGYSNIHGGLLQFAVLLSIAITLSLLGVLATRSIFGKHSRLLIGC